MLSEWMEVVTQMYGYIALQASTAAEVTNTVSGATAVDVSNAVATVASTSTGLPGTVSPLGAINEQHAVFTYINQADMLGKGLFALLLLMSITTWYLIFFKSLVNMRQNMLSNRFVKRFWGAASLEQVEKELKIHGARDPFSRLTIEALHSAEHYHRYGASNLAEVGTHSEFVTRSMRKVIDEETNKLENGLTILGSIGSTAPFIGLFGTVWGVYHALVSIGLSDGVSINKIAGPVGEALIMTGFGLAVAIPAVLAFNAFVRRNRITLTKLDGFAHDLFSFVTTGQPVEKITKRRSTPLRKES